MKLFLLVIFTILFYKRIRNTRFYLSSKAYYKKINKDLERIKNNIEEIKKHSLEEFGASSYLYDIYKSLIFIFIILIYILSISSYFFAANELNNTYILILSVIQIILTLYSVKRSFSKSILSTDIDDYKFQRFYNLVNVIVDYMYYPVVIWMLL